MIKKSIGKSKKYQKVYGKKNRTKLSVYHHKYIRKTKYNGMIEIVFKRDEYKCQICGSFKNIGIHHFDENKYNNDYWNLLTVCPSCHRSIHHGMY